jgi:dipicolinate synthase subunit A
LPVTKNGNDLNMISKTSCSVPVFDLLDCISKGTVIGGGAFPQQICDYMEHRDYRYFDYYKNDWFQIQNALLSAEGTIYYTKEKYEGSIHGSSIAIFGFGKIGKMLAFLLRSQGAKITVYARKDNDCSWSKLMGFEAVKIKKTPITADDRFVQGNYDIVINTIPYGIIDENFLLQIDKRAIWIDIASEPYCMDSKLANKFEIKYYREPAIPGRYAPKAAGQILANTIINILNGE